MKHDISQRDLFFKPSGACLRDKGIQQVTEHNENWMEKALDRIEFGFIPIVRRTYQDFTGEEIRFFLNRKLIGQPKHPNAYGALINTLVKRKIIAPTGQYRQMKDRTSHARSTPVYKSAL